jgi:signal transduction histidine kinase
VTRPPRDLPACCGSGSRFRTPGLRTSTREHRVETPPDAEDEVGDRRWTGPVSALALVALVATTVLATLVVRSEVDARLRNNAEGAASAVLLDLQLNVRRDVAAAAGLAGAVADVTQVDATTWEAAVERVADAGAFTDVAAVNLLVVADDEDALTATLEQLPTEVADRLGLRPAEGPPHAVVTNVWPEATNQAVLGYDVFDNPVAAEAASAAIADGRVRSSGPTRALQEPGEQRASVVYVPVVAADGTVTGLVNLVFRAGALVSQLEPLLPAGGAVRWSDVTGDGAAETLAELPGEGPVALVATERAREFGRDWLIEVGLPRASLGPVQRYAPWLVAALGATLVLGLAATSGAWWSTARRADALARRRTADLEASALELAALNAELAELDRFKDRLLGAVSHDLRAPLAVIRGSTEVLLDRDLTADQREDLLRRVMRQSSRLRGLIDELLVAAQVRAGRLRADRRPLDLLPLVETVCADLGIGEVRCGCEGPLPRVHADPVHVERVLHNLLTNAVSHGAPPVTVELAADSTGVEVRVRDAGPGVPPALRERVFDEYARTGGDRPGYGLGLAIAVQLADVNGGTLSYRDDGPGACFVLRLPVHRVDPGGAQ